MAVGDSSKVARVVNAMPDRQGVICHLKEDGKVIDPPVLFNALCKERKSASALIWDDARTSKTAREKKVRSVYTAPLLG